MKLNLYPMLLKFISFPRQSVYRSHAPAWECIQQRSSVAKEGIVLNGNNHCSDTERGASTAAFPFMPQRVHRSVGMRIAATLLLLSITPIAWAIGGAESMDRPSARTLEAPVYQDQPASEPFSLPPVPESVGKIDDHRRLFIKRILVEGNSVFSEQALQDMLKPYEGRNVSIAELEALRQQLTHYYIDHGYVNSGATLAADAYDKGELHIKIIEGRIDEIRVKGLERLREDYVIKRLVSDPDKPFNLTELQDNYQLLLADPLISRMNGRILPGAVPGHSILDVDVIRAKPYQLSVFGDNQRPPSIGGEAFGLTGVMRNLTGFGDSLDFTYITSAGSNRYAGGFNLPVADWGTQVFFRFDEGDSVVLEQPIRNADIWMSMLSAPNLTSSVYSATTSVPRRLAEKPLV